ncbi:MAG: T9SS type A sorting domain-containing protein [Bacteroidia bacterium]
MKKIYLLTLAALFSTAANAQNPVRLSSPLISGKNKVNANPTNSSREVTGGIKCITQYVAGSTMNLNFTIQLTNTDSQFGDSVAITFPAGFTPNTSPNNTTVLAPDSTTGCPYVKLNGVFGQVISWGDNNNKCGGITAGKDPFKFTVNVTVAAGLKGPQKTKFFVSGDYVTKNAKDLSDSLYILPTDTTLIDMETAFINFDSKGTCGNTLVPIIGNFVNNGTAPVSKIPVAYSVQGAPFVYDTIPGPIAPGASVNFKFSKPADFTKITSYYVQVKVETKGDSVPRNNEAGLTFVNTAPFYSLLNGPYSIGFNLQSDFSTPIDRFYGSVNNKAYWDADTLNPHSPKGYIVLKDTMAGTAYDGWFVFKCMDFKVGQTYSISYWKRTNVGYNGQLGIFYGNVSTQPAYLKGNVVQAMKTVTADGVWTKDSVEFKPTSDIVYLGFYGVGTSAGKGTYIGVDDITIMNTDPTGVKDIFNDNKVDVYPNPSTGLFTIDMGKTTKSIIEVYNMLGECVAKKEFSEQKNILDLTQLKPGMYSMKVIANNKLAVKQLILSK